MNKLFTLVICSSIILSLNSCKQKEAVPDLKKAIPSHSISEKTTTSVKTDEQSHTVLRNDGVQLLADTSKIFTIMDTTKNNSYALISVMPSDPELAKGTSEEIWLVNTLNKNIIKPSDLNFDSTWSFVSFEFRNDSNFVVLTNGLENKTAHLN